MTVDAPSAARRLPSNPFSTRFTRPGSIAPLDPSGQPLDLDALVDRLPAPGGCSAITGPHGHGKTSLLVAILANAGARGRPTTLVRVASPSDAWEVLAMLAGTAPKTIVGIDGWDRIRFALMPVLRLVAAYRGASLLVTTHRPGRLPVVARCETSRGLLSAIVDRLPDHGGVIDAVDIDDAFSRHRGNVREALYDLYDRFERRMRSTP
ncbi:MAG: hypothetical protein WD060_00625 [Pirellulales bacterium]